LAIPKVIYQTYSSKSKIPWLAQYHIMRMRRNNPEYEYRFFDDLAIENFIGNEFNADVYEQYRKINIGAAKADFFRYAILLKKGGIYLDLDSAIIGSLDEWILPDDTAIITSERNPGIFVQWALVYDKGHPFLQETFENVLDNIINNRYPHDIHKMTGPTVYSNAIRSCLRENERIKYRELGTDYEGHIKFKYWLSSLSFSQKEHWRKSQQRQPVLRQ
jgi:inositol phosphorylceramide mannosyltransferase catalytic subunit